MNVAKRHGKHTKVTTVKVAVVQKFEDALDIEMIFLKLQLCSFVRIKTMEVLQLR